MEIDEYILDRSLTKTPCIYARRGCVMRPILYLKKAKGATDEEFEELIKRLIH